MRRKIVATEMMTAPEIRRKWATEDPPVRNSNNGARGKYRVGGKVQRRAHTKVLG